MSSASTFILVPFILAFLAFVLRFYNRESAASIKNPSFLLAIATVLIAGTYLVLGVASLLPPYSMVGFGVAGVALLALSVMRMFMI